MELPEMRLKWSRADVSFRIHGD